MPPDGYTTVTISDDVAVVLSQLMVRHELESMGSAIKYAVNIALDEEPMTNTELARLLVHRLETEEAEENH